MIQQALDETMTSAKSSCSVCGEALQPHTIATCNSCSRDYHLNSRQDLPGKDCGEVWINEEHLGLEFACNTCLHPEAVPGGLDDVLTLEEASSTAGLPEAAIAAAADSGSLRHRRTAGGIYLFVRQDVIAYKTSRLE
jgi:hypothetical protein